jgi:SSS family solute:Na+ symporter
MLAGLLIVPVVSLFTKKPDKALVDSAFASYDKEVVVHQRRAISDSEYLHGICGNSLIGLFP